MVIAFKKGDATAFHSAVQEYIDEERRRNHPVVARDIERILRNGHSFSLTPLVAHEPGLPHDVPRDKERGTPLVELREDERPLEELVLREETQETIGRIVLENRRVELLLSHGLRPAGRVLFCGPPGCGKTVVAGALAKALYYPLALVRFDAVVSSYLGDTAANLRKVFDFARSRPLVLFFDEFDAIGKRRTDEDDHGELKRVVNSFLQMLDGFRGESLIIAATNHEQILDPALWRRFDEIVQFPRPDAAQIELLLARSLRQVGVSPSVNLREQATKLVGLSFADVERIALDAIKLYVIEGAKEIDRRMFDESVARQQQRVALTGADSVRPRKSKQSAKKARRASPRRR
ncbi:MAG: ATP-binding protein [Planctomycetes bacterium]|jgi:SpoVK/Ycf46/Vps4 family AAA+-type ATPase|nr:ATP-binding protein [Planctomycetota bacterium]